MRLNTASRIFSGFTLAELLIALAILGVIATFTIPKVLQSQQNSQKNAVAKEAASAISGAYELYRLQNPSASATSIGSITPYFNYVQVVSDASQVDLGSTTRACNEWASYQCMRLHNGATLHYDLSGAFCPDPNAAVYFWLDPDGKPSDGAVLFFLYRDGRLKTMDTVTTGTRDGYGSTCVNTYNPSPGSDPGWFSWN